MRRSRGGWPAFCGMAGAAVLGQQPLSSGLGSCGLSSFGYSGTIAHVLLTATDDAPADPGCYSWPRPVVRPMACTLKRRPLAWRDPVHPLLQRFWIKRWILAGRAFSGPQHMKCETCGLFNVFHTY